jgi:hypothetical protein
MIGYGLTVCDHLDNLRSIMLKLKIAIVIKKIPIYITHHELIQ